MHGNYHGRDWQFLARIMDESSRRLSRTRSGVSDTSASRNKRPLLLEGESLRRQSADNERRVFQWIMETRTNPPPSDAASVEQLLFAIADRTNEALLPAGRLRTWEVPYPRRPVEEDGFRPSPSRRIPPAELASALHEFCHTVQTRWCELATDPVPLAAWVEWHLNPGPLHPFYDGCGRISRSFAALILVRAGPLPPLYEDREKYFEHANRGPQKFVDYVRQRIEACERWSQSAVGR